MYKKSCHRQSSIHAHCSPPRNMSILLIEVSKTIQGLIRQSREVGEGGEVEWMIKCFGFKDNAEINRTIDQSRVNKFWLRSSDEPDMSEEPDNRDVGRRSLTTGQLGAISDCYIDITGCTVAEERDIIDHMMRGTRVNDK